MKKMIAISLFLFCSIKEANAFAIYADNQCDLNDLSAFDDPYGYTAQAASNLGRTDTYRNDMQDVWVNMFCKIFDTIINNVQLQSVTNSMAENESLLSDLNDQLATLQQQIDDANAQAQELENQQALLAEESNIMLRGKVNNIINSTTVDFVMTLPDDTTVSIPVNTTVPVNILVSNYMQGSAVGGLISFVPQVNGTDISTDDIIAQEYGTAYSFLFNVQGLNQPGYNFGGIDSVVVNRTFPSGSERAHGLNLSDMVQEDQLWAVDITINNVSTIGDGSFIYPRISTLYLHTYDETDTSTVPNVATQTDWEVETTIDKTNSTQNVCYPAFDGDTEKMWGDVTAADTSQAESN